MQELGIADPTDREAPGVDQAFDELERVVRADPALIDEVIATIREKVPAYRSWPWEAMREELRGDIIRAFAAIRAQRMPTDEELAAYAENAAKHARSGVPIDSMLQSWWVGLGKAWEICSKQVSSTHLSAAEQATYTTATWAWADAVMTRATAAHKEAERELGVAGTQQRTKFVHAALAGDLDAHEIMRHGALHGLGPSDELIPFRVRPTAEVGARQIAQSVAASENGHVPLIAMLHGDLVGLLRRRPELDIEVPFAIGPPSKLGAIKPSFDLASRALATARAFGRTGVVAVEDLSLRAAVLAEPHLGACMVERYILPLADAGEFGQTLESTVRQYLRRGRNVEEAARALHLHPNTLRHRLARFEELTGADLRRTDDIVEVWWAFERCALKPGPPDAACLEDGSRN